MAIVALSYNGTAVWRTTSVVHWGLRVS